jgi:hypothetical protein
LLEQTFARANSSKTFARALSLIPKSIFHKKLKPFVRRCWPAIIERLSYLEKELTLFYHAIRQSFFEGYF